MCLLFLLSFSVDILSPSNDDDRRRQRNLRRKNTKVYFMNRDFSKIAFVGESADLVQMSFFRLLMSHNEIFPPSFARLKASTAPLVGSTIRRHILGRLWASDAREWRNWPTNRPSTDSSIHPEHRITN